MNIAIIDDQEDEGRNALSLVGAALSKLKVPVRQADYYPSGSVFFKQWSPGMYDIILLDIFLINENGLEIAKTIRRIDCRVPIVFCSSSNDFASESYDVCANYYLVKPLTAEKADHMIRHLKIIASEDDSVLLPDNTRLLLSQFVFSEYHNHLITIHCRKNKILKVWSSQMSFSELLSGYHNILVINPGTIINMREVELFSGDTFHMSDGSCLPISMKRKKELQGIYNNYLFEILREEQL